MQFCNLLKLSEKSNLGFTAVTFRTGLLSQDWNNRLARARGKSWKTKFSPGQGILKKSLGILAI